MFHILCKNKTCFLQVVLSEVLDQTTRMEWRVSLVNALIHRIAIRFKLKVFASKICPENDNYWADNVHLSDNGLRLFMNRLERFLNTIFAKCDYKSCPKEKDLFPACMFFVVDDAVKGLKRFVFLFTNLRVISLPILKGMKFMFLLFKCPGSTFYLEYS